MFVGHYGAAFAIKRVDPSIPLWVLFLAVQLLDVFWAPFIFLGVEKVRIVPGPDRAGRVHGIRRSRGASGAARPLAPNALRGLVPDHGALPKV